MKLQIWDTAGQERFQTITKTYYRNAQGVIIAYDVTSEDSFVNVKKWVKQIEEKKTQMEINIILIGNKCDTEDRQVLYEEGQSLAESIGVNFYETSAMNNYNIKEVFTCLAKEILSRTPAKQESNQNIDLKKPSVEKEKKKCCK